MTKGSKKDNGQELPKSKEHITYPNHENLGHRIHPQTQTSSQVNPQIS